MATPRNNPGNIRYSKTAKKWVGQTGQQGGFVVFDTINNGARAMAKLLAGQGYWQGGRDTVRTIVTKYAPPSENNTPNYIRWVSEWAGVLPDQKLNPDKLAAVAVAMIRMEQGQSPTKAVSTTVTNYIKEFAGRKAGTIDISGSTIAGLLLAGMGLLTLASHKVQGRASRPNI